MAIYCLNRTFNLGIFSCRRLFSVFILATNASDASVLSNSLFLCDRTSCLMQLRWTSLAWKQFQVYFSSMRMFQKRTRFVRAIESRCIIGGKNYSCITLALESHLRIGHTFEISLCEARNSISECHLLDFKKQLMASFLVDKLLKVISSWKITTVMRFRVTNLSLDPPPIWARWYLLRRWLWSCYKFFFSSFQGIRFRGYTIPDCQELLPKAPGGNIKLAAQPNKFCHSLIRLSDRYKTVYDYYFQSCKLVIRSIWLWYGDSSKA